MGLSRPPPAEDGGGATGGGVGCAEPRGGVGPKSHERQDEEELRYK
jgi:hypothetical protein